MYGKLRNLTSVLLAVLLMLSLISPAFAAQNTDIKGHWAQNQISEWFAEGLVKGYDDGSFKPDNAITRAEFMTMVNKAFGFTKTTSSSFTDVNASDWFAQEASKAKAAGYITGYKDGSVKPNNRITRQEAAVIMGRILKLKKLESSADKFSDASSIPSWSKGYIGAIVKEGYIKGYPDNTFKPSNNTSRAEAVTILSKAVGELYNIAGEFGPATGTNNVNGNLTISKAGVKLSNTIINGNLYLSEGIGDGAVTLDNVTVKGTTTVSGGGEHSIVIINSVLGRVVINIPDNSKVRVVAQGTTSVDTVETETVAKLEESNVTGKGFGEVKIEVPQGASVELAGDFDKVEIAAPKAQVSVLSGTVKEVTVGNNGKDAQIKVEAAASITTLVADAAISVGGSGKIETAKINADGVSIEQKPVKVEVKDGVTDAKVGGQDVGKPASPPAVAGGGGGGGGGGSNISNPPSLRLPTSANRLDKDIEITFADNSVWRAAITDIKLGTITLTKGANADYEITAGKITFHPATGITALKTAGTWIITVKATGYNDATLTDNVFSGLAVATNCTVIASQALAKGRTSTFTLTAKDKYGNPVGDCLFSLDAAFSKNSSNTVESYTVDTITGATDITGKYLDYGFPASDGTATFTVTLPATIDKGDGLSVQVRMQDGTTAVGNPITYFEPIDAPTNPIFTDYDPDSNQISGILVWDIPYPATGITGYKIYFIDISGNKIGEAFTTTSCDDNAYNFAQNTAIPEGAIKFGVYSCNPFIESVQCALLDITDNASQSETVAPTASATDAWFLDVNPRRDVITGDMYWYNPSDTTKIEGYRIYFLDSSENKLKIIKDVLIAQYPYAYLNSIDIPQYAAKIGVYSYNAAGECATGAMTDIRDNFSADAQTVPTYNVSQAAFTDYDTFDGQIGNSSISWTKPDDDSNISGYKIYYLNSNGSKICSVKNANILFYFSDYSFPQFTAIPYGAVKLGIYSFNAAGECADADAVTVDIIDNSTDGKPFAPADPAKNTAFTDTDSNGGEVGGTISWTKATNEGQVAGYKIYFIDSNDEKVGSALETVTVGTSEYSIPADTVIPFGAVKLGIYSFNAGGDCAIGAMVDINDNSSGDVPVAPAFVSATTSTDGTTVLVTFSKDMADPDGEEGAFEVLVNGYKNGVTAAGLNDDNGIIELTLTTPVANGDTITVAYAGGTVKAEDAGVLETFTAQTVTNAVPVV